MKCVFCIEHLNRYCCYKLDLHDLRLWYAPRALECSHLIEYANKGWPIEDIQIHTYIHVHTRHSHLKSHVQTGVQYTDIRFKNVLNTIQSPAWLFECDMWSPMFVRKPITCARFNQESNQCERIHRSFCVYHSALCIYHSCKMS